jgi:hypothetical protein
VRTCEARHVGFPSGIPSPHYERVWGPKHSPFLTLHKYGSLTRSKEFWSIGKGSTLRWHDTFWRASFELQSHHKVLVFVCLGDSSERNGCKISLLMFCYFIVFVLCFKISEHTRGIGGTWSKCFVCVTMLWFYPKYPSQSIPIHSLSPLQLRNELLFMESQCTQAISHRIEFWITNLQNKMQMPVPCPEQLYRTALPENSYNRLKSDYYKRRTKS